MHFSYYILQVDPCISTHAIIMYNLFQALGLFCGAINLIQKLDDEEIKEIRRITLPCTILWDCSDAPHIRRIHQKVVISFILIIINYIIIL